MLNLLKKQSSEVNGELNKNSNYSVFNEKKNFIAWQPVKMTAGWSLYDAIFFLQFSFSLLLGAWHVSKTTWNLIANLAYY